MKPENTENVILESPTIVKRSSNIEKGTIDLQEISSILASAWEAPHSTDR